MPTPPVPPWAALVAAAADGGALNDDGIGAALRAVHADMAHSWNLKEIAEISHMSRSAFAQAFKSHVGVPPLEYLIQWRMNLARDALARDTLSISELARATGYQSESAFSTAFRRVVGSSPARFRAQARRSVAHGSCRSRPALSSELAKLAGVTVRAARRCAEKVAGRVRAAL